MKERELDWDSYDKGYQEGYANGEDNRRLLILKTLIEVYDKELDRQNWFHLAFCKRCESLMKQREEMIKEVKEMLQ